MSKEQQELLDEAYKNYVKWWEKSDNSCNLTEEQSSKWLKLIDGGLQWAPFSQEEYINKCKTDKEFSEKWGLKIEERELSAKERWDWYRKNGGPSGEQKLVALMVYEDEEDNSHIHSWLKTWAPNVPTKLITITYNDKTIESYDLVI